MEFIKTYYTKDAYNKEKHKAPLLAFIIETGEVIYRNDQRFSDDFSDDFALLDLDYYKKYFGFYS